MIELTFLVEFYLNHDNCVFCHAIHILVFFIFLLLIDYIVTIVVTNHHLNNCCIFYFIATHYFEEPKELSFVKSSSKARSFLLELSLRCKSFPQIGEMISWLTNFCILFSTAAFPSWFQTWSPCLQKSCEQSHH